MSKTIHTVVDDIYRLMQTKEADESVDVEAEIEKFGEGVKALMRTEFARDRKRDTRTLRLSNIGRDDRYLWNVVNNTEVAEEIPPHTYVKFMYGHIIEEMLLFLTRMAGHTVTDEQKVCEVEGIKGHMDCKIDGVVVDVKSASSYAFKKFKDGTLAMDDSFGYVDQLKAYAYSEGQREIAWLAMDKQNGHLTVLKYDLDDTQAPIYKYIEGDIAERIREVKKLVGLGEPEVFCSDLVEDGKSGNLKLGVKCSYCMYKKHCYPDLRAFAYSYGPRFLAKVVNEPKVQEITLE
jgi:type III secretion system FlhB-like substrate exporter